MSATNERRKMIERLDLVADLVEERRVADSRLHALERELANREFDIRALEDRNSHLMAQVVAKEELAFAFEERAVRAEQAAHDMHNRILALHRSTSWRLAGPMRRIVRLLRRAMGRPA